MSVNGKGEVVAGGGRRSTVPPEPAGPRIREEVESDDGDDPGIEEVREKLLAHLREAADRMKLVVPSPPKDAGRKAQPAPAQEERLDPEVDISAAPPARPWNLRTRRGAARAPTGVERLLSGSPPGAVVKRTVRRRPEDPGWRERPKFSISLTRDEIEEDIYAVTGFRIRGKLTCSGDMKRFLFRPPNSAALLDRSSTQSFRFDHNNGVLALQSK
ncbi:hypothetical protein GW17_00044337 [Ensete ventricosum]|nr:hypothetical protein GW17_00044337 [Ensete ventricosum]